MNAAPSTMPKPYSGEIVDGAPYKLDGECVWGRGACEQKGSLAAMMAARYGDLGGIARPPVLAPPPRDLQPPADTVADRDIWTVSFATLLNEDRVRDLAARIRVDGRTARIIAGIRDGIPIWRVVLGPFDTRDAAERWWSRTTGIWSTARST